MAMGLVDDSEFEAELLDSSDNKENRDNRDNASGPRGSVIDLNRGRGVGNNEVPESLRKIIGEESIVNGRSDALDLARQFGISPSSVSAYANGATSTASYNEPNEELNSHLKDVKEEISEKARGKLLASLDELTDDKLKGTKARDLASIAKDMSAVVKNMETENGDKGKSGPTFVIFAPKMREESTYETITVNE